MPDKLFEDPRLVALYDEVDGSRSDLDAYVALLKELNATSVLDIGSGTGCLAIKLVQEGFSVTGVEPAEASLEFARRKPNADRVRWILGDATRLPAMAADASVMTGNVAQVFLTDDAWAQTLNGIRRALHPSGHLVFEARDPAREAWLDWTREKTYRKLAVSGVGNVECWCEVLDVSGELVTFRWTYVFQADGQTVMSDSTIRFRERPSILHSLESAGYLVREVRDAPDRPGKEMVFVCALLNPRP